MKTILSLLLLLPFTLFSQIDSVLLDSVVITETYFSKTGITVEKSKGDDDVVTLLGNKSSFTTYSDNGSSVGYSYFRMRGMDMTRVNMTLDGIPLNEPEDQGVYFSNYPDFLSSVSRVGVQKGIGGKSLNGTASFAGSVQFMSPILGNEETEVGIEYGSFNHQKVSLTHQSEGLYLRGSYLHTDGFKDHSENTSGSLFYSLGTVKNDASYKLVGFVGHQRNQMAWLGANRDVLANDLQYNANTPDERDRFTQAFISTQGLWQVNGGTVRNTMYFNFLQGNYDLDLNNFLGDNSFPPTMLNYNLTSHFVGTFTTLSLDNFTCGVHLNTYRRYHRGSTNGEGQYENHGDKSEVSIFIRGDYELGKDFELSLDMQLRSTKFSYVGDVRMQDLTWTFTNPKATLTWKDLYYTIGRTSREPTRTDIFGGNDNYIETFITTPETVVNQELGITRPLCSVNLFLMQFRDEITLKGQFAPNSLFLNESVDKSYRTGIELGGTIPISNRFSLVTDITMIHARIEEEGTKFSPILTPRFVMVQTLRYQSKKNLNVYLTQRMQGKSYLDLANTEILPSFVVLSGGANLSIKSMNIEIELNNLLNSEYFTQGYLADEAKYFAGSPLNFKTSITFKL